MTASQAPLARLPAVKALSTVVLRPLAEVVVTVFEMRLPATAPSTVTVSVVDPSALSTVTSFVV